MNFTQELVRINSANPLTSETSDSDIAIEKDMALVIYSKLEEIGLTPKLIGVSQNRPNVVVTLSGSEPKTLILYGHMDTVWHSDKYTVDLFSGLIKNGKMYGVGVLDMKASLASFIFAAIIIKDLQIKLKDHLITTFVEDEEPG